MLRSIAPVIKPPRGDTELTPHPSPDTTLHRNLPSDRTGQFIIDDLDAQASSYSTIQPNQPNSEMLTVRCSLVRIDIRCPAPPSRRGNWGDDAHLRSGIVTLDIHGLGAHLGQDSNRDGHEGRRVGGIVPRDDAGPRSNVEWQKMILFFCRVPGKPTLLFSECLLRSRQESICLSRDWTARSGSERHPPWRHPLTPRRSSDCSRCATLFDRQNPTDHLPNPLDSSQNKTTYDRGSPVLCRRHHPLARWCVPRWVRLRIRRCAQTPR